MGLYYTLDAAGDPVPEPNLKKFLVWYEHANQNVLAKDTRPNGTVVTTVFLGLNYRLLPWGKPILWATRVQGRVVTRYTSRADALAGHAALRAQ